MEEGNSGAYSLPKTNIIPLEICTFHIQTFQLLLGEEMQTSHEQYVPEGVHRLPLGALPGYVDLPQVDT